MISLDIDDGSILRNRYDLLLQLKEHYPELKVSLFYIPYDYEAEMTQLSLQRKAKLKLLKDNLDWIELIPHGVMHIPSEFEKADRKAAELSLQAIDEAFRHDDLPYVKGFKAPFWLWNQEVVDVLDENGWWGAVDKNNPKMLKTKKVYTYTHSIYEPIPQESDIALHGHMSPPSQNDIGACFVNLMKIPHGQKWCFASERVCEKK
jgi:hypothetical protein